MAALSAPRKTDSLSGGAIPAFLDLPVAADAVIFAGGMVQCDATGYATAALVDTDLICFGVALASADATGLDDGDLTVRVQSGAFWLNNSSSGDLITIAERGQACYVVNDQTVAKTDGSASRSVAGRVLDATATQVLVMLLPLG